jgi:hypothetical protein
LGDEMVTQSAVVEVTLAEDVATVAKDVLARDAVIAIAATLEEISLLALPWKIYAAERPLGIESALFFQHTLRK